MSLIKKSLSAVALCMAFTCQVTLAADMPDTITVSSTAFANHDMVPLANSAYGDNVSPQLSWSDLPEGTVQLALVMDDPVVPMPQPFVHWVAYNIPADASEIPG